MAFGIEPIKCTDPADPRRCQASKVMTSGGQCNYLAKEGSQYCPIHASMSDTIAAKRAANQYRLTQYQERMSEFTTSSEIKNLRAEIGISRMVLEGIVNACKTDTDMLAFSGKISDMVMKIGKLIQVCQRLDIQMGMMLDRDKIMIIGKRIVEIVEKAVPNKEILDEIGEDIVQAIMDVSQQ